MSNPESQSVNAFVFALLAFVISASHVICQYLVCSVSRTKVNAGAIGILARTNQYTWSSAEWRFLVYYAELKIRAEDIVSLAVPAPDPPHMREISLPLPPCKATWCNLITDLGVDPAELPIARHRDADTIPSALDAPTMRVRMSDLVKLGLLLDMEVSQIDIKQHTITMFGENCNIVTQKEQGVGTVSRYSGSSCHMALSALSCTPEELRMLLNHASGSLYVGDLAVPMDRLGYNAIDFLLRTELERISNWCPQEMVSADILSMLEGDVDARWNGRWRNHVVPVKPFLLALAGNPAVCNSFPHTLLGSHIPTSTICKAVFVHLECTAGFSEAPTNFFRRMREADIHIVLSAGYKTTNNGYSGVPSWLCSDFSTFAEDLHKVWPVPNVFCQVPVLSHLPAALKDGKFDAQWAKRYERYLEHIDRSVCSGINASTLLWLQIMMLDAWIAHRIEAIMGSNPSPSPAVCEDKDADELGWKECRFKFLLFYLRRLADLEGWEGRRTSCITSAAEHWSEAVFSGWENMPSGMARDWVEVDAALTLRGLVMAARFELMKDSSSLLDLQRLDPVILVA